MVEYKKITFEEILPFWKELLWTKRSSAIETHSAIVYLTDPYEYDASYFGNTATFIGAFADNRILGVNSGHMTQPGFYRSRGLYVHEEARGRSIGSGLLAAVKQQGASEGAKYCWSMPRLSSLPAYKSVGFVQTSEPFGTETSDSNVYAVSHI